MIDGAECNIGKFRHKGQNSVFSLPCSLPLNVIDRLVNVLVRVQGGAEIPKLAYSTGGLQIDLCE